MTSAATDSALTVRSGWFARRQYGSPTAVAGSVAAYVVLICFAGYAAMESAYLTSVGGCFDASGQMATCPASGPDWAGPLPGAVTLLGSLSGLAGVLAGRPVRSAALIAGFLLVAAGLVASRLMSPT